ncbi:MAG: ATP-binding protein, partial [Limisphaerales bacterium]
MSRTIQLSRIHALNWYGYKDSIDVDGNLLLAGVTGSGKSILMDLVQFVLVGDQRLVRFNQSATGDRSDRSLKGYCLGDTKHEENGVTQYMRQSAITYVALEFRWPNGKRFETWGLRVEYASAAESQGKVTPFFVPASLTRSDFLSVPNEKNEKFPLDYTAFKAMAESRGGRVYSEGIDTYLRDMAQNTHLNFDRGILRSLLPSAMSFTFLRSFNEFCRQFILPADKLHVSDVTDSYRTFLSYDRDLTLLNDQFVRLREIRDCFTKLTDSRRDRALARYLEAELRLEHATE